jgi:hypothetical protein
VSPHTRRDPHLRSGSLVPSRCLVPPGGPTPGILPVRHMSVRRRVLTIAFIAPSFVLAQPLWRRLDRGACRRRTTGSPRLRSHGHRGLRRLAGALRSLPSYVDRRPLSSRAERAGQVSRSTARASCGDRAPLTAWHGKGRPASNVVDGRLAWWPSRDAIGDGREARRDEL